MPFQKNRPASLTVLTLLNMDAENRVVLNCGGIRHEVLHDFATSSFLSSLSFFLSFVSLFDRISVLRTCHSRPFLYGLAVHNNNHNNHNNYNNNNNHNRRTRRR